MGQPLQVAAAVYCYEDLSLSGIGSASSVCRLDSWGLVMSMGPNGFAAIENLSMGVEESRDLGCEQGKRILQDCRDSLCIALLTRNKRWRLGCPRLSATQGPVSYPGVYMSRPRVAWKTKWLSKSVYCAARPLEEVSAGKWI